MNFIVSYGTDILDGKIIACDKIKRQYEKLLHDLDHQDRWHFDEALANRPIEFIERFCRQSQGERGKPIRLEPFQKALLQAAFGFVDDFELRRYQEVLLIIGRKNGKTTLLAGLQLYMQTSDKEGAPECYQIATTKEQAMKGFVECDNMRRMSPLLRKHIRKRQGDLYCADNFGTIKALASQVDSLDGLNSHFVVIDELQAIKKDAVYDDMKQSISSRRQPMIFSISTNGFLRECIFDSRYEYAANVLDGRIRDERFLPLIYELDRYEEWTDPAMWVKANPGLGTIKRTDILAGFVEQAKQDDRFRPTVLVKDFNLKQNSAAAWLSWEELDNKETFDVSKMGFRYGIGGFDAADSVDLNAARMLCRRRDDPRLYWLSMYWIPERKLNDMRNRKHPDDAPYEIWAARGLLRVVPGNKVNKRVFLDWFLEMRDQMDIYPLYIGYDPWHIDDSLLLQFEQEFGKNTMVPVRQGVATLSQPMKDLAAEYKDGKVVYNNNPIDKWCLANTYTKRDVNGNIQPDKGNSATKRIDGTAAQLDAYVVYCDKQEELEALL